MSWQENTYARFRLSTTGGLSTTGLAPDGEVEDHVAQINSDEIVDLLVGQSNNITLRANGNVLEIIDNNNGGALLNQFDFDTTNSLTITGGSLDDVVTIDFDTTGFFTVPGGIVIDGAAGSDSLNIVGTGTSSANYLSTGGTLGNAGLALVDGAQQLDISFTDFEPLSVTAVQAFAVTGTLNIGAETLTIGSTTDPVLSDMTILSGGTISSSRGIDLPTGSDITRVWERQHAERRGTTFVDRRRHHWAKRGSADQPDRLRSRRWLAE